MKNVFLPSCLLLCSLSAMAQTLLDDCGKYDAYVKEGRKAMAGIRPDFPLAIQSFRAARDCKPAKARVVDSLLVRVFDLINKQKIAAGKQADALRKEQATTSSYQNKTKYEAMALAAKDSLQYNPVYALGRAAEAYQNHHSAVTMGALLEAHEQQRYVTDRDLDQPITTITTSPSQHKIALAKAGSKSIYLYDSLAGIPRELYGHQGIILHLAFSPDGQYLVSASDDHTIKLWTSNGIFVRTLREDPSIVKGIAFSPDSRFILTGSKDGSIRWWSLDGRITRHLTPPTLVNIAFFAVSPNKGKMLAVGSDQKVFYGSITGETGDLHPISVHPLASDARVLAIGLSPDGRSFAISDSKRKIHILNDQGYIKEQFTVKYHVVGMYFLNDRDMALATTEGPVLLYQDGQSAELTPLIAHQGAVTAMCRIGSDLWSAGSDKTFKQWDYTRPKEPYTFIAKSYELKEEEHLHTQIDFELISNGTEITISRPEKNKERSTIVFRRLRLNDSVDIDKTNNLIASWGSSPDSKLILSTLNTTTGKAAEPIRDWDLREKGTHHVAFSEDGYYLLVEVIPTLNTTTNAYETSADTYEDRVRLLLFRTPAMVHKLAYPQPEQRTDKLVSKRKLIK